MVPAARRREAAFGYEIVLDVDTSRTSVAVIAGAQGMIRAAKRDSR